MQRSERDELKRAINKFQELANPQALMKLLAIVEELEQKQNESSRTVAAVQNIEYKMSHSN